MNATTNDSEWEADISKITHDVLGELYYLNDEWTAHISDMELVLAGDASYPNRKILEEAVFLAENIQIIKARILKSMRGVKLGRGLGFFNTLLKRWNIEGFEMTNPEQPSLYEALLTLRGDDYGLWIVDMDHSEPLKFRREQT